MQTGQSWGAWLEPLALPALPVLLQLSPGVCFCEVRRSDGILVWIPVQTLCWQTESSKASGCPAPQPSLGLRTFCTSLQGSLLPL